MTGEHLPTECAAEKGLLNPVYPDPEFAAEVEQFIQRLANQPLLAVRAVKDSGNMATEVSLCEGVNTTVGSSQRY